MKDEHLLAENGYTVCSNEAILKDEVLLCRMMERMMLVRKFEEKVQSLFAQGFVHGTTHLGIGEEATGVGTTFALYNEDYMLATHRGHGQAIGKGGDVNKMMAEILAKDAGPCHGRGGSMHIAEFEKGILGANGIVGANAPLACGAAFTCRKKHLDRVCVAFLGDGAANEGAVHESMNLAAAWKLPVIFALVNNTYGMSTPLRKAVNDTDLTKRAIPYGMKCIEVDGNDVLAVYEAACEARAYVVAEGPVLLVEHTYRISGHSKSDGNLYRTKEEIALWKARCPIKRFAAVLIKKGIFSEADIAAMDARTTEQIERAVEFAKACPEPAASDALNDVYAI